MDSAACSSTVAVTMQQETPAERRSTQGECWITVEERSGNAHQKVTPRLCTSGAFPCAPAFSAGVLAAFPTAWIRLLGFGGEGEAFDFRGESGGWGLRELDPVMLEESVETQLDCGEL
jgi:hypothetical protein